MLARHGKPCAQLVQAGLWEVPHRDPFDRLLAAQAQADHLVLASTNPAFAQFGGVVVLG